VEHLLLTFCLHIPQDRYKEKEMKKVLKWVGIVLLVVLVGGVLFIGGPPLYESIAGPKATDYTNVTYPAADGTTLHAYLAEPEGEGPFPGVVLIHEWWGLNEDITQIADALASEGYVVLAPDAYRGETTNQIQRALVLATQTPAEQIDSDLDSGLMYLQGLANVEATRTAAMGFCFGWTRSIWLRHPSP
jgi:carboxymethylenebutenolidase